MSLNRWNPKRDVAERPIIDALKAVGCDVWAISGKGAPDLLVRKSGILYAAEVKSKGGKLTKHQGAFPIWRTPDEALQAVGISYAQPYQPLRTKRK